MFDIIIFVIVLATIGYLTLRNYKFQVMLAAAGIFLIMCDIWLGFGGILNPVKGSGYLIVDIYNEILRILSNRTIGLGLSIMAVGSYAHYAEHIGASRAVVSLSSRPLEPIRSSYIILSTTYVINQIVEQFIISASDPGMLLMVILFPTLVSLGVNRFFAMMVIATTMSIEQGIPEASSIPAAQVAGMKTATYLLYYQLPVASCVIIPVAISYFFMQRAFDKEDKNINHGQAELKALDNVPPLYYAILPVMPSISMLGSLFLVRIGPMQSELHLVVVMLLSLTVTMFVKFFHKHSLHETMDDVQTFFNGMGTQFANAITLVVMDEIFAGGLMTIGTIDAVVRDAEHSGLGGIGVMVIVALVTAIYATVMGSGNASFMSLVSLIPSIVVGLHVPAVVMIMPIHLAMALMRAASPITVVVVVTSGIAGASPFAVVKRTVIPMAVDFAVNMIATITLFY